MIKLFMLIVSALILVVVESINLLDWNILDWMFAYWTVKEEKEV